MTIADPTTAQAPSRRRWARLTTPQLWILRNTVLAKLDDIPRTGPWEARHAAECEICQQASDMEDEIERRIGIKSSPKPEDILVSLQLATCRSTGYDLHTDNFCITLFRKATRAMERLVATKPVRRRAHG